jgi:hypothetical protein
MKVGGVKTHIYFKGLLSPFYLKKSDKYKTIFCWILFWKLLSMIENGLTKQINPNTNIVMLYRLLKELFMWRHIPARENGAFYHVEWKYIPYFTQTKKYPLNILASCESKIKLLNLSLD